MDRETIEACTILLIFVGFVVFMFAWMWTSSELERVTDGLHHWHFTDSKLPVDGRYVVVVNQRGLYSIARTYEFENRIKWMDKCGDYELDYFVKWQDLPE
jgi:hypothetical protein